MGVILNGCHRSKIAEFSPTRFCCFRHLFRPIPAVMDTIEKRFSILILVFIIFIINSIKTCTMLISPPILLTSHNRIFHFVRCTFRPTGGQP